MTEVSVVIPTYNRADLVGRAIDSALDQSIADLEVIVVDDASDDDTDTVVRNYDDPRVQFHEHRTNRGGAAARNTGIDAASGEYIAFLDSDDEWLPRKLQRQLDVLADRGDQYAAAYCDIVEDRSGIQRLLYDATTTLFPAFEKASAAEGGSMLVPEIHSNRFHLGGTSTLLVEREAVEAIDGFDESFPRHQDLEFLVRLLHVGHLAYVPEELVVRHDTGLPDVAVVEDAKERYFEKFDDELEQLTNEGTPVYAHHRFSLARLHYQRGHFRSGTRYLLDATPTSRSQYLRLLWSIAIGARRAF